MKKSLFILTLFTFFSLGAKEDWQKYKEQTLNVLPSISGWCSKEKGNLMMDLIHEKQFEQCVEIGVFGGCSLFPIAKALKYNEKGVVFAIDAWDLKEATKGWIAADRNYLWWRNLDYNHHYAQTLNLIFKNNLHTICNVLRIRSLDAIQFFEEESIDFIHFDGNIYNLLPDGVTEDLIFYFPKVKEGGYILLSSADSAQLRQTVMFLLENAELISNFDEPKSYLLFRKNKALKVDAEELFHKPPKPIKNEP